jgi:hypothetical protein
MEDIKYNFLKEIEILTKDGSCIPISSSVMKAMTDKSPYWKDNDCKRVYLPFSKDEFCVFQTYIITGNVPHNAPKYFEKMCKYFGIQKVFDNQEKKNEV